MTIRFRYLAKADGGANITIDVLYRFADHFGVSPAVVIDDVDCELGD